MARHNITGIGAACNDVTLNNIVVATGVFFVVIRAN